MKNFKNLLADAGFKVSQILIDIPNAPHSMEHLQYGVQMELVSLTGEYDSPEGILKTTIGSLSPRLCLEKLIEKVEKGKTFDCFYRGNKGKYSFSLENGILLIKSVN